MKTSIVGLAIAVLLLTVSSPAHADVITLTSGGFQVAPTNGPNEGANLQLRSDAFFVQGFFPAGGLVHGGCALTPCHTGDVVDFSSALDTSNTFGVATINGVTHSAIIAASLQISTPAVAIEGMTSIPFDRVILPPHPFTLTGSLKVRTPSSPDTLLLDTSVVGSGSFQVTLNNIEGAGQPSFLFNWADFRFHSDAIAPTPEPATVVMLAMGVAAIFGTRSSRHRRP